MCQNTRKPAVKESILEMPTQQDRGNGNINKHVNVEVEIIRTKNYRQLITAGRGELAFPRDESSFGYPVQTS